jgi:hypothetical protein
MDETQSKIRVKMMRHHHDDTWLEEPTNVKEVWFAGAHCDVGGGSVKNGTPHALARIPLRWMIKETFRCNTGILYQTHHFDEVGLDPHTVWPKVIDTPRPSTFTYKPLSEEPANMRSGMRNRGKERERSGFFTPSEVDVAVAANKDKDQDGTNVDGDEAQYATYRTSPEAGIELSSISNSLSTFKSPNAIFISNPTSSKWGSGSQDLTTPPSPIQSHMDEMELERLDAISQIFDQLSINWFWWILELMPMRTGYQNPVDEEPDVTWFSWMKWMNPMHWTVNMGYGRRIKKKHGPFYVHRSVKTRMELTGYKPNAIFKAEPLWVD